MAEFRAVLDTKNAAFYLDMTTEALRDLVKGSKIPYKKRGDKLIFLICDLEEWLRDLPGLNASDVMERPRVPAHLTDLSDTQTPHNGPISTEGTPAIPFTRGARRQVPAPSIPRQA